MSDTLPIRRLAQALSLFRDLDPEIPAQQVLCFLLIAAADKEDIHMRDLQSAMGIASSSTTRNVQALSEQHRLGKPGLDLVETYEDSADRRYKRVRLKPKGRTLMMRLKQIAE